MHKIVRILQRNKGGKNGLWQKQSHFCSIYLAQKKTLLRKRHTNGVTVFMVISQKWLT